MTKLTLQSVRKLAEENGKNLKYNRSQGGYQITYGFTFSEIVYPTLCENSRRSCPTQEELRTLKEYI